MLHAPGAPDYRVFGMLTYTAPPFERKPRPQVIEKTVTVYKHARIEGGQITELEFS